MSISKRSKPVRSAKAALTRFGSVLRGTKRPYELHSCQLRCETIPYAPKRFGHRLTGAPRPGFAGLYATVRGSMEGSANAGGSAIKRSAFGWIIPTRSLRSLPAHKRKAVARLCRDKPTTDLRWFIPHSPQGPSSPGRRCTGATVPAPNPRRLT